MAFKSEGKLSLIKTCAREAVMRQSVWIGILAAAGIFLGCDSGRGNKDRVDPDLFESEKVQLQNRIDRKFDDPQAHYQLGKIYQRQGLLERAAWAFTLALQFDPVHYAAQAAKVCVYKDLRQTDRMAVAAELYIDQAGGSAESLTLLGRAFQAEGLGDYALVCYQKALDRAPNSALLCKQLGFFYLSKQDLAKAEEYLRKSIQIDPYQPDVAEQLGRMGVIVQVPHPSGASRSPSSLESSAAQ